MKTLPIDDHNQGIFFHKLRHFFPIFEKGQERRSPVLPPLVSCLNLPSTFHIKNLSIFHLLSKAHPRQKHDIDSTWIRFSKLIKYERVPHVFFIVFFFVFFLLLLFFSLRNRTGVTSNFVAWCKACSCFYFVLWNLFSPLETYSKPNLDFELLIIWCKFKLKWISNIKISLTLKSHWLLYWVCRHST